MTSKDQIAETLEGLAQLLDLKGENPFKIRAYQQAARAVEMYAGDLAAAARAGKLEAIEGIGKSVAGKIAEMIETGKIQTFERMRGEFPAGLFDLFDLPGMGAKKIKAVYEKLAVTDLATLETACRDGRVAALAGFGAKTAQNVLAALEKRREHAQFFRLGDVAAEAGALLDALREHEAVAQVSEAGSFRRRKEVLHDLDFVVSTRRPAEVIEFLTTLPAVVEVLARGEKKISLRLRSGIQCDVRIGTDAEFPFVLHHFTGSKEHNIALRTRALQTRGWSINEYGIRPVEGKPSQPVPEIHTEGDFFRALGLNYIPPELREAKGEVEAAETGTLPELVALENLRGTFHCHTRASDGRNSLEEMAEAAHALGLEYLGIADHSKSSVQANGLDEKRVAAQREEIEMLNRRYADERARFRVFAGVECDIQKDGTLDFDDGILAALDYVVISVHSVFQMPEAEMTARLIRAMENPYATMLGHLTGRLLLTREPYHVDVPAVIEAAARTGTMIELNANPRRLEMDWRWWKLAKEKGVRCAINPDAHRVSGFQDLWFGVAQARKGWLTRSDVVNCLPLEQIQDALREKRNRMKS